MSCVMCFKRFREDFFVLYPCVVVNEVERKIHACQLNADIPDIIIQFAAQS